MKASNYLYAFPFYPCLLSLFVVQVDPVLSRDSHELWSSKISGTGASPMECLHSPVLKHVQFMLLNPTPAAC